MNKNTSKLKSIVAIALYAIVIIIIGVHININKYNFIDNAVEGNTIFYEISNLPEYNGEIYVEINNNIPNFTNEDMTIQKDYYSSLEKGKVRDCNGEN